MIWHRTTFSLASALRAIYARGVIGERVMRHLAVLPQGAIAGITSRSAKPGDTIIIYGIGLGAMTPALPIGQITEVSNTLSAPFQFYFGSTLANTIYSGLAPGQIGVYQFNVVVPAISGGDFTPISFSLGGVTGTQTLYTAVQGN